MYAPVGSFTTTSVGFKTIASVKYRLFRFDRLPNVTTGLWLVDNSGSGAAGEQQVAYVGDEGIGYAFDFAPGDEDVFSAGAVEVPFYRLQPDLGSLAAEAETQRRLTALTRVVGGTISPEQSAVTPTYRGLRRFFAQYTPVIPGMELLDSALAALRDEFDALVASLTTYITDVIVDNAPVTGGLREFKYTTEGAVQLFTVPAKVKKVKIYVTGGGAAGGSRCGGAGATLIGFMPVTPGQNLGVTVGHGGRLRNANGTSSKIYSADSVLIGTAEGGNLAAASSMATVTSYGTSVLSSYITIKGGHGLIDTDEGGDEESLGGASFWGSSPAWGGGSGAHSNNPVGYGGDGYVLFEW